MVAQRFKASGHNWNSQEWCFSWAGFQLHVVQSHLFSSEPLTYPTAPSLTFLLSPFTSSQPSSISQEWLISKVPASAWELRNCNIINELKRMRCFKCFQYASPYNYLQKTCSLTISECEAVAPSSECFFFWWGWRWRWEQGKGFCKSWESFAFSLGWEQVRRGVRGCRISNCSQQMWRQHNSLDQGHRTCVQILAKPREPCAGMQMDVRILEVEHLSPTAPCHGWKLQLLLLE